MRIQDADRLIRQGNYVTVRSKHFGEQFTVLFVKRDRRNIQSIDGGLFDRLDLEIISENRQ